NVSSQPRLVPNHFRIQPRIEGQLGLGLKGRITLTLTGEFIIVIYPSYESVSRGTRPDGRASLPRICDSLRPIAPPYAVAAHLIAFRAHARDGGAATIRPSRGREDVSKSRATTSRAAAQAQSRAGHPGPGVPGSGGALDQPARRKFGPMSS